MGRGGRGEFRAGEVCVLLRRRVPFYTTAKVGGTSRAGCLVYKGSFRDNSARPGLERERGTGETGEAAPAARSEEAFDRRRLSLPSTSHPQSTSMVPRRAGRLHLGRRLGRPRFEGGQVPGAVDEADREGRNAKDLGVRV